MLIQNKRTGDKGFFYIEIDGNVLAEMSYTMPSENKMIIEHTEVSDELKGQKVGYELVHAAVEYARHHYIKILPVCSFANAVFNRKPEYADVLFSK